MLHALLLGPRDKQHKVGLDTLPPLLRPPSSGQYICRVSAVLLAGPLVAQLPRNRPDALLSSYTRTDPQDLGFGFTASLDTDLSHDALTLLTASGLRK